jgi:mannose-6-phosphate isomerase-like protein (cupin superfamily)
MKEEIARPDPAGEFKTEERCWIIEAWNDPADESVSIARARVEPNVTTQLHELTIDERYLIVEGVGRVTVGGLAATEVTAGDVVVIPRGIPQNITNTGDVDLIFYCICSPRFTPDTYRALE